MRILNSLRVPKYLKGETLWAFWHFSSLQNNKKNLKMGPFEGKKFEKKSHSAEKHERGDPSDSSAFANARKKFWLKQGLEPVAAGFTVNREKSVLKSGRYAMGSVV